MSTQEKQTPASQTGQPGQTGQTGSGQLKSQAELAREHDNRERTGKSHDYVDDRDDLQYKPSGTEGPGIVNKALNMLVLFRDQAQQRPPEPPTKLQLEEVGKLIFGLQAFAEELGVASGSGPRQPRPHEPRHDTAQPLSSQTASSQTPTNK